MNTGMLWFDNDQKVDLKQKVERAATYYQSKYGRSPNLCFVHPSMIQENSPKPVAIEVKPNKSILPNHFWLGIQVNSVAGD